MEAIQLSGKYLSTISLIVAVSCLKNKKALADLKKNIDFLSLKFVFSYLCYKTLFWHILQNVLDEARSL